MKRVLILIAILGASPVYAKVYKFVEDMPVAEAKKLRHQLDEETLTQFNFYKQVAQTLNIEAPPPIFWHGAATWRDNNDHSKGTQYAAHLTPEARQWIEMLTKKLNDIGADLALTNGKAHIFANRSDTIKTDITLVQLADLNAHAPVDSKPNDTPVLHTQPDAVRVTNPNSETAPNFNVAANYSEAKTTETNRIVRTDSIAAIDLEKFGYLVSGLKTASEAGYVAGSNELIDVGLNSGNLVLIPAGETVTVHKVTPMPKIPGASMVTITYRGQDLIMVGFENSFASTPAASVTSGLASGVTETKVSAKENQKSVRADQLRAQYTTADNELNAVWAALTPKQRACYRDDERNWIKLRDGLPTLEERILAIQTRTEFLRSLAAS
jgi:hypothetical protein